MFIISLKTTVIAWFELSYYVTIQLHLKSTFSSSQYCSILTIRSIHLVLGATLSNRIRMQHVSSTVYDNFLMSSVGIFSAQYKESYFDLFIIFK